MAKSLFVTCHLSPWPFFTLNLGKGHHGSYCLKCVVAKYHHNKFGDCSFNSFWGKFNVRLSSDERSAGLTHVMLLPFSRILLQCIRATVTEFGMIAVRRLAYAMTLTFVIFRPMVKVTVTPGNLRKSPLGHYKDSCCFTRSSKTTSLSCESAKVARAHAMCVCALFLSFRDFPFSLNRSRS